jgi:hypothetical protein
MTSADRAWVALGVGVVSYDVLCGEGETMSEGADRYMLRHPWLVRGVAFILAAHVCNLVKSDYDPLHWGFVALRRIRR